MWNGPNHQGPRVLLMLYEVLRGEGEGYQVGENVTCERPMKVFVYSRHEDSVIAADGSRRDQSARRWSSLWTGRIDYGVRLSVACMMAHMKLKWTGG
jgi:hypothetical protein